MTVRVKSLAVFMLASVLLRPSLAAPQENGGSRVQLRRYTVIGMRSCEEWIENRKAESAGTVEGSLLGPSNRGWLMGYVSGMNRATSNEHDLLQGVDFNVVVDWADKYCKDNQKEDLGQAVDAMFEKLKRET